MSSIIHSFQIFLISAWFRVAASVCQPAPITIAIQSVTLSNNAQIWGIALGVGTPEVNVSMLASANNQTYIYGRNSSCDTTSLTSKCVSYTGGAYDRQSSSSSANGVVKVLDSGTGADWVTDILQFQPNVSLQDFDFGIMEPTQTIPGYRTQAELGLGRNSSLLGALKQAGRIGSRAYSFFWGLSAGRTNEQSPGSLILGGFDQSIAGDAKNLTAPLNFKLDNCSSGLLVSIDDVRLNWPNGTEKSLFAGSLSTALQACIFPDFAGLMTIPAAYWTNFLALSGSKEANPRRSLGPNYDTMLLEPDDIYDGDLTISIQDSISIRIPNDQLVVSEPTLNDNGQIVTNASSKNIVLNSLESDDTNDLPILGRLFFASAYLLVNHDANAFTVWQANAKTQAPQVEAVASDSTIVGDFCANDTVNAGASGASSTNIGATSSESTSSHLSKGTIVGIVVGAFSGTGILSAVAFLLLRRPKGTSRVSPWNDQPVLVEEERLPKVYRAELEHTPPTVSEM